MKIDTTKLCFLLALMFLCTALLISCERATTIKYNVKDKKEPISIANFNNNKLNDSLLIDDAIINAIIMHYKNSTTATMETESTDSSITLYFKNNETDNEGADFTALVVDIPKLKQYYLLGDLNNDELPDLLANIATEGGGGGGNVYWNDLFVFISKNYSYELASVMKSPQICGCTSGLFSPNRIYDGLIEGESICWAENDAHCCPSLEYYTEVEFKDNILQFRSKKEKLNQK